MPRKPVCELGAVPGSGRVPGLRSLLCDILSTRSPHNLIVQGKRSALSTSLPQLDLMCSLLCQLELRKACLSRARHPLPTRCCAHCSRCRAEPHGSPQRSSGQPYSSPTRAAMMLRPAPRLGCRLQPGSCVKAVSGPRQWLRSLSSRCQHRSRHSLGQGMHRRPHLPRSDVATPLQRLQCCTLRNQPRRPGRAGCFLRGQPRRCRRMLGSSGRACPSTCACCSRASPRQRTWGLAAEERCLPCSAHSRSQPSELLHQPLMPPFRSAQLHPGVPTASLQCRLPSCQ